MNRSKPGSTSAAAPPPPPPPPGAPPPAPGRPAREKPYIDQTTLARRLGISGPSVVKLIDALEGAGYIARAARTDDRRRYALALVDAGRVKLDEVRTAWSSYEGELTRGLSATQRQQLLAMLRTVAGEAS